MMDAPELEEGRVDLWYVYQDRIADPGLLDRYQATLSEDETVRWQRFLFEKDRHRFLIARAMLRDVLSRYARREPQSLAFQYNEHGKPSLQEPAGLPIRFNLSHSGGLAVCAVTTAYDVGVDVETPERPTDVISLARRYFAASEVQDLGSWSAEEQKSVFFEFWTLKEAYIKARGKGLSIPLDSFAFSLAPERPPSIGFIPGTDDTTGNWQFAQIFLGSRYPIALALRSPQDREMAVQIREVVPLDRAADPVMLAPNPARRWVL